MAIQRRRSRCTGDARVAALMLPSHFAEVATRKAVSDALTRMITPAEKPD